MLVTKLLLKTQGKIEFINLTDKVKEIVALHKIQEGTVTIRTLHTTTGVILNENEAGLLEDAKRWLEKLAPETVHYEHDDMTKRIGCPPAEPKNGQSHLQAMLLGSSVTIPVIDGVLSLGKWQAIFLVELDGPRHERTVEIIIN